MIDRNEWIITYIIMKSIRERDRLYKQYKKNPLDDNNNLLYIDTN